MSKLVLPKVNNQRGGTINRTIRFDGDIFDTLTELTEETGLTFNKLVNVCLRYAIDNIEETEEAAR